MRTSFPGFYTPTEAEFDRLWKEAVIILDTNALLDLYRLPPTAREELFKALEFFQERLWIPHHVGLEFQRNRFKAITGKRKPLLEALKKVEGSPAELKSVVEALQLEQLSVGADPSAALENLESACSAIKALIDAALESEPNISTQDSIRDRLSQIFGGRIGNPPATQTELDALCRDGDARYELKIPPGFADAKDKADDFFIHKGLRYESRFGDLILWRQTIAHIKDTGAKAVLFVTSDQKLDWWWKEDHRRVIGPHQELTHELMGETQVNIFWMYKLASFLEHSPKYTLENVTNESVEEIKDLERRSFQEMTQFEQARETEWAQGLEPINRSAKGDAISAANAFRVWLQEHRGDAYLGIQPHEVMVDSPLGIVYYLVLSIPSIEYALRKNTRYRILQYRQNKLEEFPNSLVGVALVVRSYKDSATIDHNLARMNTKVDADILEMERELLRLNELIIGTVGENNEFQMVWRTSGPHTSSTQGRHW
ncbi:PIN-like domain-containing protein [Pseudorhizobium pelagicum]|uniref:PIN like domain-containing protein n=1 Tax=Pseudorhizobium pelagicum TaxID=1509405 RepID=A0A922T821_9HYPH|nr:PIN-like domain-containing protein [Pseudorhizobium pelagicum]KEQ07018.1 hypothetical protein GV67_22545 [Pseudorhizobium pelagicum]KEQ09963.1 hypothetical protein GV68_18335 [Pseudorhizobium pelagicum]